MWGLWRAPTLQPNMREMVLLVQATLQWHSIGEKQSSFLMLGDIFSLTFSASEEAETRLSRERCLLLPLRPPPPPPPPPLLLVLPALTIHPHSSHHSITPGEGQPDCFLHPAGDFSSILSVWELLLRLFWRFTKQSVPSSSCLSFTAVRQSGGVYVTAPWEPCCVRAELFCLKSSSQGSEAEAAGSFPQERYRVQRLWARREKRRRRQECGRSTKPWQRVGFTIIWTPQTQSLIESEERRNERKYPQGQQRSEWEVGSWTDFKNIYMNRRTSEGVEWTLRSQLEQEKRTSDCDWSVFLWPFDATLPT